MYGYGYKYTASGSIGSNVNQPAVISDIVISLITDVSLRVTCNITPNGTLTPVLHYGESVTYGSTLNGTEISEAGSVVFNVTGLAAWTDYYCKVVAGATELAYEPAITTLVPVELSDTANNYGHYIFDDASNRKDTSNLITQLRDLNQSNAVGADADGGTGVFDSDTGWSLAAGWSVPGGKLNGAPRKHK
ncbi:MAG: hypothetical protein IPN08_09590 [Bacteroidales bacterium]|nr:hypothetical protein [Bacteroidales bacterium]